jgi:hypothetical protein
MTVHAELSTPIAAPARAPAAIPRPATDHHVLGLQRLAGNRAVASVLANAVVQRDPPTADAPPVATATTQDSEGNDTSTTGGKPHVEKLAPAGITFPHLGSPLPQALPPNPAATFASLKAQVVAARKEQLDYATSLKGDMKYWFAKVYYFVTDNVLKTIDAGAYEYPIATLQETIAFHATYRKNLDAWRAGKSGEVESNWKIAFGEAESVNGGSWYRTRAQEILSALLPSMQAHIRFDLPRAIASVYETNYGGIPGISLSTFRADFDRMGPVFETANANIQPEINAECYAVDFGDWGWLQKVGFPAIFHIGLERQHAFEKAGTIVDGHARGINDQQGMQNRLEAYSAGAHPGSGGDDFSISTSYGSGEWAAKKVSDYDWNAQP